jgi:hypothetical protein
MLREQHCTEFNLRRPAETGHRASDMAQCGAIITHNTAMFTQHKHAICRAVLQWSGLVTAIFALTPAHAARDYLSPNPPPHAIEDRFKLEVDLMRPSYDTQVRLDATPTTPGTLISAEDDLGLDESQLVLQMELTLLPGEHHLVRLHGFSMRRDGYKILNRPIVWETSTYAAGERADSRLNISMIGLTYGWLPFREDRYELGVTVGIQIASVDANVEVRRLGTREPEDGVAPIPLIGLEGRYDFTRRWSVDGRYQYLSVNRDDVSAKLTDARLALRWRQNQHLVFGLGYRMFDLNIESAGTSTPGFVSLGMTGPMLFLQGSL